MADSFANAGRAVRREVIEAGARGRPKVLPPMAAACLAFLALACSAQRPEAQGRDSTLPASRIVELQPDAAHCGSIDRTVSIDFDPSYGGPKRYLGMPLRECLARLGHPLEELPGDLIVQFVCTDGYAPYARVDVLRRDDPFLASRDAAAEKEGWQPLPPPASDKSPAPFYLVWPNGQGVDEDHPWPYAIATLRIGDAASLLDPARPAASRFTEGFELFRAHCIKCHAINGVGGSMGVELNVPYNIFEYWQRDKLALMVRNPGRLRRNTRMPAFEGLGDEKIALILEYVESMKDQKIAVRE